VPGPGTYVAPTLLGKESSKFTMPGRLENEKKTGVISPGPAAYEIKDPKIDDKKKVFSFSKDAKAKEEKRKNFPGPGQYDNPNDMIMKRSSPSWKYLLYFINL